MIEIKEENLIRRYLRFDTVTYALLFLFPIAGMLVRGWLTNIFNVLFLVGVFYLHKSKMKLRQEEKVFLLICTAYVSIYFLSGLMNGWGPRQTHDLGTEIRFWMIIPIYLLVREQLNSWRWYLYGALIASAFIFGQSYYEIHWLDWTTAWGAYSKNLIGPFSALLAFYVIELWRENKNLYFRMAIILAFCMLTFAAAVSGSRGGYVGYLVMLGVWLLTTIRGRWVVTGLLAVLVFIGAIYNNSTIVKSGVNRALNSFVVYFQTPNIAQAKIGMDSTEIHLEMWRAAKYFFPDHPILGVGPGNYKITAQKYAEQGKVNPVIAKHGHPHNIYLEALYSKGIIGLASLLLLLYYPLFIVFKTRKISPHSAGLVLIHILGISAFSLFDASPILFNNYTSILLLGIAVFWSHHLNEVKPVANQHA